MNSARVVRASSAYRLKTILRRSLIFVSIITLAMGGIATLFSGPNVAADSPTTMSWDQLSVGSSHKCGISQSVGYCWGYNNRGQLGDGTTLSSQYPVAIDTTGVLSGKTLASITTSDNANSTCALDTDGKAYCWGANSHGLLGDGTTIDRKSPVAVDTSGVLSGKTLVSLSMGSNQQTCALDSLGAVYCWGKDMSEPFAVDLDGLVGTSLSSTNGVACIIATDGFVYCWGSSSVGELGVDGVTTTATPLPVDRSGVMNNKTIRAIDGNVNHFCAVDTTNHAYCWGNNEDGQLGTGDKVSSDVPVTFALTGVLAGKTILSISAGQDFTCVVASDHKAYCVGSNDYAQLGTGGTVDADTPVAVDASGVLSGISLSSVQTAAYVGCVLDASNQAYCWGNIESENTDYYIESPIKVVPRPVPHIQTASFQETGGNKQLLVGGTGLMNVEGSDIYRGLTEPFVYLGGTAVPFCNYFQGFGLDADQIVAFYSSEEVVDIPRELISDTPTCYEIGTLNPDTFALEYSLTPTSMVIDLADDFDTTAETTLAIGGSNIVTLNAPDDGSTDPETPSTPTPSKPKPTGTKTATTTSQSDSQSVSEEDEVEPTTKADGGILSDNETTTVGSLPTFSGTAPTGTIVTVTVHSDPVSCSAVADSNEEWICTLPTALEPGQHSAIIAMTTPSGKEYEFGPYALEVEGAVDTMVPETTTQASKVGTFNWMPWLLGAAGVIALLVIISVIVRKAALKNT